MSCILSRIFEGFCPRSVMASYGGPTAPAMKQVKLEKESELRIEVNVNTSLRLRLLNGTAEIFGTEMPPENWLIFPPRMKFAVITLSTLPAAL